MSPSACRQLRAGLGTCDLTASTVVLLPELVANLPTALPPPELPALLVSWVQVASYHTLIELGPGYIAQAVDRFFV
jgi:hypothetical protein